MSADFDPYHKWLGIPPREQPPHHYRLLGIALFETDAEVIEAAANRQMYYLQELSSGPHVEHSQRLLNEVSAARLCLLDDQRRSTYDQQLREKLAGIDAASASAVVNAPAPAVTVSTPAVEPARPRPATPRAASSPAAPRIDTRARRAAAGPDPDHLVPRQASHARPVILFVVLLLVTLIGGGVTYAFLTGQLGRVDSVVDEPDSLLPEDDMLAVGDAPDFTPAQPVDDARREPIAARADGTEKDSSEKTAGQDADAATDLGSEIPEPGADVDPAAPSPSPPALEPKPEALRAALVSLDNKDLEGAIRQLEEFVDGRPDRDWEEEARNLLSLIHSASSDELAKEHLTRHFGKMNDEQAKRFYDQIVRTRQLQLINFEFFNFGHPALNEIHMKTVMRLAPQALQERYRRIGQPKEVAKNKPAGEREGRTDDGSAEKKRQQPVPTDPAELMTFLGLRREGNVWLLEKEIKLKEKQYIKRMRDLVSSIRTAQLAGPEEVRDMLKQLENLVGQATESVEIIEKEYQELADDQRVAEALEELGGKLGPSSIVSKTRIEATRITSRLEKR